MAPVAVNLCRNLLPWLAWWQLRGILPLQIYLPPVPMKH